MGQLPRRSLSVSPLLFSQPSFLLFWQLSFSNWASSSYLNFELQVQISISKSSSYLQKIRSLGSRTVLTNSNALDNTTFPFSRPKAVFLRFSAMMHINAKLCSIFSLQMLNDWSDSCRGVHSVPLLLNLPFCPEKFSLTRQIWLRSTSYRNDCHSSAHKWRIKSKGLHCPDSTMLWYDFPLRLFKAKSFRDCTFWLISFILDTWHNLYKLHKVHGELAEMPSQS